MAIKILLMSLIFCTGVTLGQYYNPTNIEVRSLKKYYMELEKQLLEIKLQSELCRSDVEYVSNR
jgi:hypothetical protein